MDVLAAMRDPKLLGAAFPELATWRAWCAFLAALFALRMDGRQLHRYRRHTGRKAPPAEPAREAWVIAGRRAGKSRIAALVAVYLAAFGDYSAVLAPGERGVLMVLAADRRQARTVFRYIGSVFDASPLLSRLVKQRTAEAIHLTNGISVEVHTASYRSTRGYTVVGAILDEVAFWRDESSANPDAEILAALRPGMATVPGALLLGISTPYARRGALWTAYREHFGREGDPVLVWRAPTRAMNPTVPASVVERAQEEDPASAAAEYGAEFRADVESFLAREAVEACIVSGRRELPRQEGTRYAAFIDPSGGSRDSMTLAIGHREGRSDPPLDVLDVLRERRPPFSPDAVVGEFAEVLRGYGLTAATGDAYGGAWPAERFRAHGIEYAPAAKPKSELYRELLPVVNAGRVELLDDRRLLAQLLGLERRTSRAGRDTIDHAPTAHDDLANAAAGVIYELRGGGLPPLAFWSA